jgi:rhamnosyltransferase subunit B
MKMPIRYLLITVGSTGDIHPFMHLARQLIAHGREVMFISNTVHQALIEGAGLRFIGMGSEEEFRQLVADPDIWDPRKCFSVMFAKYDQHMEQIRAAIQEARGLSIEGKLVVIAHAFALPAVALSRAAGEIDAIAAAYLAPCSVRSIHDPLMIGQIPVPRWVPFAWRRAMWGFLERGWIDPVPLAHINRARSDAGLPPAQSFLGHLAQVPDLSLFLFPPWFAASVPDWPQPMTMLNFPVFEAQSDAAVNAELSHFLDAGDKPIVFTPGTANVHAARFFAAAIQACARLGKRAILLTKERAQCPAELPAHVLWQPYVPLASLLPRAAALVHHGGIGTTAEALRAGIPQVITPFGWDQFDNGARVRSLGVGEVRNSRMLRAGGLARSLKRLMDSPEVSQRCREMSQHFQRAQDSSAWINPMEAQLGLS